MLRLATQQTVGAQEGIPRLRQRGSTNFNEMTDASEVDVPMDMGDPSPLKKKSPLKRIPIVSIAVKFKHSAQINMSAFDFSAKR